MGSIPDIQNPKFNTPTPVKTEPVETSQAGITFKEEPGEAKVKDQKFGNPVVSSLRTSSINTDNQ
jgi:hypothetical protein